jgi:phosphatidylinositol alpha-mannosyltransferase
MVDRLGISHTVRFEGRVGHRDLPRYYAGCDVYCSPALGGESFGIVLIEAMACGAPVVASAIPGYDETIRADSDGLLCPPGDASALASTLVRVLMEDDLRESMSRCGIARSKEFAWTEVGRRTLDYYRQLMRQQG